MTDSPGEPETKNSLLLPAEVIKPDPQQNQTINVSQAKKKPKKSPDGASKIWYGWLQGWLRGRRVVNGCIDIIQTGRLRVNLHVKAYERGKWPFFKPEYALVVTERSNVIDQDKCQPAAFTIQIPAPLIKDINEELNATGVRTRQRAAHTWTKKKYRR